MTSTSDDLVDIQAIESLKARYCRLLDTKDWSGFRALFADDFESDTTGSGGVLIQGGDHFVGFVRKVLGERASVHQVQQPEITLTSPTTASGVWAMRDVIRFAPGLTMCGFGHYHETYVKTGDQWLIASLTLTRLREEIQTPLFSVVMSDRLRRGVARLSKRWGSGTGKLDQGS